MSETQQAIAQQATGAAPPAQAGASFDMQFGVPLDRSSIFFFACLIAATGLIYLYCQQKFNERMSGDGDYVYQLLPRQMATPDEYAKGFMIYFGTMAGTLILLSLIGPKDLRAFGIPLPDEISYFVVPIAIAFFWIGVMPTVPGLQFIERTLRQYAQEQAYIPQAAQDTAGRLSTADFDFARYQGDALHSPELRGVEPSDFTAPRRSIEHDWARLCCLVYEEKSRRMANMLGELDARLLSDYAKDLDAIEIEKAAMETEVAAYRAEKTAKPGYVNQALWTSIQKNLRKLYILIGCAVRLKQQPYQDVNLPLRQFGFRLDPVEQPGREDLMLVCIAVIAIAVLSVDMAGVFIGQLGLWMLSPPFPQTYYQPLVDTGDLLVPFGTAIIVANLVRKRGVKGGWWRAVPRDRRTHINGNYLRVAVACGVVAYLASLLWSAAFGPLTADSLKMLLPNVLFAMLTGGFYVYHLDNVETETRPGRIVEAGGQAILTGLAGLVAAAASLSVIFPSEPVVDRILLQSVICTIIGLSLGWYLPKIATIERLLHPAGDNARRAQALEREATERFGSAAAANQWLEAPHPALGGKSPRAAAGGVDGHQQAMALLRGPQEIAA
jgi:hypothetical protein